jgi:hypothetical protein
MDLDARNIIKKDVELWTSTGSVVIVVCGCTDAECSAFDLTLFTNNIGMGDTKGQSAFISRKVIPEIGINTSLLWPDKYL